MTDAQIDEGSMTNSSSPSGHAAGREAPADPPDPQLRDILTAMRAANVAPAHIAGAEATRERIRQRSAQQPPGPAMHKVEDIDVPATLCSVPSRWYRPSAGAARGVIVYFHGGGWVVGGIIEADALCRRVAAQSGLDVVSVGYRLAPEHRFPTAVGDADAATRWVAEQLDAEAPIIVLGDSAGGNLATVVARRFRDRWSNRIALQVLVYPVTDHRMKTH